MSLTAPDPRIPPSPLARWDARWKLAALIAAGGAGATVTRPMLTATALGLGLAGAGLARLNPRDLAARLGLVLFGMLPVLAVFPFTNENGLTLALTMTARALAVACVGLVLLRTTPMPTALAAAHRLRLPGVLVQIALLAHRYSFLFFAEARRMRVALRTRAFRAGTDLRTYRTTGQVLGTILIRGGDRAEQVADAMRARGFDGRFHTVQRFRTTAADVAGFALVAGIVAALLYAEWWL
jgi:cobalt/nickel transport system permease protein